MAHMSPRLDDTSVSFNSLESVTMRGRLFHEPVEFHVNMETLKMTN